MNLQNIEASGRAATHRDGVTHLPYFRYNSKYLLIYKKNQYAFDQFLRKTEVIYLRKFTDDLEEIGINNPKAFRNRIKTLGPDTKEDILLRIYGESSGSFNWDIDIVRAKWKNDFSNLLNNNDQQNFDNTFLMLKIHEKNISEQSENNIHIHAEKN